LSKAHNQLFIPSDWKQWIAENIARNSSPTDLQKKLEDAGFDADLSRAELETASRHPYMEAARSLVRQLAKRDWLLHTHRKLRESVAPYVIERRSRISSSEFLQHYYSENRPVILTNCFDHWNAMKLWNRQYLMTKGADLQVEIQENRTGNARFEQEPDQHRQRVRFSDFIEKCFDETPTNDIYMTARNGQANTAILELLGEDLGDIPDYLDGARSSQSYFLWIGPPGTTTPLHHDMTNNFMAQIVGQKRVRLIAPDFHPYLYNNFHCYSAVDLDSPDIERFPLFQRIRIHDMIIGPGDLLFLPIGWWHHVQGMSTSITLTCTNFKWPNDFGEEYTTFQGI